MANAKTWPSGLKDPTLASANVSLDFGYENSEMEYGTLRQRQKFQTPVGRRSVEVHATTFEASRAIDFLRRLNGASFDMPLAVPGDPFVSAPTVSARFMGGGNWRAINGGTGMLSFDVFVEALPAPADENLFLGFDAYEESFLSVVNQTDYIINTLTPASV